MQRIPKRLILGLIAVLLIGGVVYTGALAADIELDDFNETSLIQEATFPRDQAVAVALNAVPGTMLEVDIDEVDGKVVYEIDVRPDNGGPDMEVVIDGVSGTVLETTED